MKKVLLLLISVYTLNAGNISIAVASNVSYAIDVLKNEFNKKNPNIKVNVTIGSSGKLTAQIKYGAPYQLFMSANMIYPQALYREGLAITKPVIYAKGTIAYFSTEAHDFSKGISVLAEPSIKRIAIANPLTAPYGKASMEALKNAHMYKRIKNKFVLGESISQTLSYAVSAADIGIIAKSALYSPKLAHFKEHINWSEVDTDLYTPIDQGIVILKKGQNNPEVEAFYTFMLSEKAQNILLDFGYILP